MTQTRFPLMVRTVRPGPVHGSLLSFSEVARLAGIHPELLNRLVTLGLVDPAQSAQSAQPAQFAQPAHVLPEPLFEVATVLRIRRILRLRNELGVNWAGIGLVLDLLSRVEKLEQEIVSLKSGRGRRR